MEEGQPPNFSKVAAMGFFINVDLQKTRAYGVGLAGLYFNLEGREKDGIVKPGDRVALLDEIGEKLLRVIDPQTGGVYSR